MKVADAPRRRDMFDAVDEMRRQYGDVLGRAIRTPEAMVRTEEWLLKRLLPDPLIARYLKASAGNDGRGARITEPWMGLAEQRMVSLLLASRKVECWLSEHPTDLPADIDPAFWQRLVVAVNVFISQTFVWSDEIFKVVRCAPLPSHVIGRDLLPFPWSYHTYEVAYQAIAIPESGHQFSEDAETDWLQLSDQGGDYGIAVTESVLQHGGGLGLYLAGIRYGTRYPEDIPLAGRAASSVVLSMLAFLRSPFVEVEQRLMPRQMRRQGELAPGDEEKTVGVVKLRRAASEAVAQYNAESRSWKHRWWVAGHFRKQWYASQNAHQVIWIAPHLKGPEGAPMLEKVYAVVR